MGWWIAFEGWMAGDNQLIELGNGNENVVEGLGERKRGRLFDLEMVGVHRLARRITKRTSCTTRSWETQSIAHGVEAISG